MNYEEEQPRKRGRPKGTGGNHRVDLRESNRAPGENTKFILHSMRLAGLPAVDKDDTEQVGNRVREYFDICAEEDVKPSVAGLALAMGVDRRRLWEIREGKRAHNPEVSEILKMAMQMLELQMVDYMQNGAINPICGIFLSKNHFGYADKQEVVVTPVSALGEAAEQKALEDKYIESVVLDSPPADTIQQAIEAGEAVPN